MARGSPPKGELKLKTEKTSAMAMTATTAGQKVCVGRAGVRVKG